MTLDYAKEFLLKARRQPAVWQLEHRAETVEAFRCFWLSRPSEEEFAEHTASLVLFPEMIYIMAKS